jgi:hypothetical protein
MTKCNAFLWVLLKQHLVIETPLPPKKTQFPRTVAICHFGREICPELVGRFERLLVSDGAAVCLFDHRCLALRQQ